MSRFAMSLIAYAVLGGLTWWTITDSRMRAGTLLILGLFALKTVLRRGDTMHSDKDAGSD